MSNTKRYAVNEQVQPAPPGSVPVHNYIQPASRCGPVASGCGRQTQASGMRCVVAGGGPI
jgi:hypothetical protein